MAGHIYVLLPLYVRNRMSRTVWLNLTGSINIRVSYQALSSTI